MSSEGCVLGSLAVMDIKPRTIPAGGCARRGGRQPALPAVSFRLAPTACQAVAPCRRRAGKGAWESEQQDTQLWCTAPLMAATSSEVQLLRRAAASKVLTCVPSPPMCCGLRSWPSEIANLMTNFAELVVRELEKEKASLPSGRVE